MTPTAIHLPDVRMTFAERVKALALVTSRMPKMWASMGVFWAGGIAVLVLSARAGQLDAAKVALVLACIAFIPLLLVYSAWTSRRADTSAIAYLFTSDGVRITTDHTDTQMSWTNVRTVGERGGFLMLRLSAQFVLCLPRRVFASPSEVSAIRALAREAGVEGA